MPLVLLAIFIGGLAVVGYYIYQSVVEIRAAAEQRMSRRNINFSNGGMRVGVKDIGNENYVDKTQRWVVKAWELSGNAGGDEGSSNGNEPKKRRLETAPPFLNLGFLGRPLLDSASGWAC